MVRELAFAARAARFENFVFGSGIRQGENGIGTRSIETVDVELVEGESEAENEIGIGIGIRIEKNTQQATRAPNAPNWNHLCFKAACCCFILLYLLLSLFYLCLIRPPTTSTKGGLQTNGCSPNLPLIL